MQPAEDRPRGPLHLFVTKDSAPSLIAEFDQVTWASTRPIPGSDQRILLLGHKAPNHANPMFHVEQPSLSPSHLRMFHVEHRKVFHGIDFCTSHKTFALSLSISMRDK